MKAITCALGVALLLMGFSNTALAGSRGGRGNRRGNNRGSARVIKSKHTGVVKRIESVDLSAQHAAAKRQSQHNSTVSAPVSSAGFAELLKAARAKREADAQEEARKSAASFSKR
jgi:hypothetical protein